MYSIYTMAITLFLVMDALGVIPIYIALVKKFPNKHKLFIALREMVFALIIMVIFYLMGPVILSLLKLTPTITQIAGGIVMFLIAIRLIFSQEEEITVSPWERPSGPFIVPIATPLIAGPSVLAVIMIYSQENQRSAQVLGAIFIAWAISCLIFLLANPIYKRLTEKGLNAAQRLMGLVIAVIAIQMCVQGIKGLLA